jgi:hypothetical protein
MNVTDVFVAAGAEVANAITPSPTASNSRTIRRISPHTPFRISGSIVLLAQRAVKAGCRSASIYPQSSRPA